MQKTECDLAARGFISAKRTAEIFGVHEVTLAKWRMLGTGPRFYKLRGRAFYKQSDIDSFIEAQARTSTSTSQGRETSERWLIGREGQHAPAQ
jgi:hypothetical protein